MIKRNKKFNWLIITLCLIALQTLTYFTLGEVQLKNKLLPNYFSKLNIHSDSVYILEQYTSECFVGDDNIYITLNLRKDEKWLKEKLNVRYIYFAPKNNIGLIDSTENKFNLIYRTWTSRKNWVSLFGLYGAKQTEIFIIDNKYHYKREGKYHWILLYWFHTFEWFESSK